MGRNSVKAPKRVEGLLEARIKAMENSKTPGRASRSNRREEEDLAIQGHDLPPGQGRYPRSLPTIWSSFCGLHGSLLRGYSYGAM